MTTTDDFVLPTFLLEPDDRYPVARGKLLYVEDHGSMVELCLDGEGTTLHGRPVGLLFPRDVFNVLYDAAPEVVPEGTIITVWLDEDGEISLEYSDG